MTVYTTSELGWSADRNITDEFKKLVESGKLKSGDTLVIDEMYEMTAGARLQLPDGVTLSGKDGGGLDMQNTANADKPMIYMGNGGAIENLIVTASEAPDTGYIGLNATRGIDFDPARAIGIEGVDNVSVINSSFSGNIGQFLSVHDSDNLVVSGTHFDGARSQVVMSGDVTDAQIYRSHFEGALGDGIKTIDGNILRPQVIESLFEGNQRDGIDTTGGFKDGLIKESVFYENSSAFDIKSQVHDSADLTRTDVNSGIRIEGGTIVGSSNAIVISFRDYAGLVNKNNADNYIPNDIEIVGVTFEDVGRAFLIKDGYDIRWSDLHFQDVDSEVRIMNINAPSDWSRIGDDGVGGTYKTSSPENKSVEELWNYDVGVDSAGAAPTPVPVPEPVEEPTVVIVEPEETVVDETVEPAPVVEETGDPEPSVQPTPPSAPAEASLSDVLLDLSGETLFDGRKSSVIELVGDDEMNVNAATVRFTFNADDLVGRQGLFSKDAAGYTAGDGHMSIWLDRGTLNVRFQADDGEQTFKLGNISAKTDYDVVASFGDGKVIALVDGNVIGEASSEMSWTGNGNHLQLGGLGWASKEDAAGYADAFSGKIEDVTVTNGYMTEKSDAIVVPGPPASEDEPEVEDIVNDAPADAPLATDQEIVDVLYGIEAPLSFDGTKSSVVEVSPTKNLELQEGTIAFTFNADEVSSRQGLVSKDATGYSKDGGHFTSYLEKGSLKVRFQSESEDAIFEVSGIKAGKDYDVAASFGDGKVALWLNDNLVGESALDMDWTANDEYLQIGANGWASAEGEAGFRDIFTGEITDFIITDQYHDPEPEEFFLL
ncbi:MAG: LamG-like jellyroll fold domain-containing protein [Pseudomonadota bacterium]